jgi:hypothetical protein
MVNYQDAKIYKLASYQTDDIYIGSTCGRLSKRFNAHKTNFKKNGHISSKELMKYSDCKIILIENWPCNDINELKKRERYHIENNTCVNKYIPGRTDKERRIEKYGEPVIKPNYHYADPRYWETKICTCGGTAYIYAISANTSHNRTKRHQRNVNYMQILEEDNVTIRYNYFAKKFQ